MPTAIGAGAGCPCGDPGLWGREGGWAGERLLQLASANVEKTLAVESAEGPGWLCLLLVSSRAKAIGVLCKAVSWGLWQGSQ